MKTPGIIQARLLWTSKLLVIAGILLASAASAQLLPFPLSANQRATVVTLEPPVAAYDIYLPPAYSTNGPPLPIFYTFDPSGGGMVSYFRTVCSNLNIIAVGIVGPRNGDSTKFYRESYAVSRDIRRRVLFDPTAEFTGGFSGGAVHAYWFSRFRSQHVSGVFAMSGWLGISNIDVYRSTNRVQTNLFIARTTGTSSGDSAARFFLPLDSNYLASCCSPVIRDWDFSGGHQVPSDAVKAECLSWLVSQRALPGLNDQTSSEALAANWRSRISTGEQQAVLRECVNVLMTQPRSWNALQAQRVLDDLESDFTRFRSLHVENLAEGDYGSDLFYFMALGAADAGQLSRYRSCLKALTGVPGALWDRTAEFRALLTKYRYVAPILQRSDEPTGEQKFSINKDTPGLIYELQSRTNLSTSVWQARDASSLETETTWSAVLTNAEPPDAEFYRVRTYSK